MIKRLPFLLCNAVALVYAASPLAQEREDRTLLSHDLTYLHAREQAGLVRLVKR